MKTQQLLMHLCAFCLGILIFTYIADRPMIEAANNSYWAIFGGIFVWFKMKKPKTQRGE